MCKITHCDFLVFSENDRFLNEGESVWRFLFGVSVPHKIGGSIQAKSHNLSIWVGAGQVMNRDSVGCFPS